MKRLFVSCFVILGVLLACISTPASAAPAAPVDIILVQPDGMEFAARQWGDEWQSGFETPDGYTILQDVDAWWVYAAVTKDGALVPALADGERMIVGAASPLELAQHQRPAAVEKYNDTIPADWKSEETPNSGTQRVLVLLVSFSNQANTYTASSFANLMFGATNSVKHFYSQASFSKLALAPAAETNGTANDGVVGWLNLGYNHPNTGSSTGDANQKIVKDALIAANSAVNYASFDTNSDGYISNTELHIIVVVAGYERSYSTTTPNIWAHRWTLDNIGTPTLDGVVLGASSKGGGYAQFGERHGTHQATIGIMAHELGHDLTWPDLYDTDGGSEGVGDWSIMGGGSWNGITYSGDSPSLPDAFLKYYQGWITPTAVNGTLTGASIPQAETNAKAYLLRPNPNGVDWNFRVKSGTGEYFLVENRNKTGYDTSLPGCGLMIWHIDETRTYLNTANANETRPLVRLVQADGLKDLENESDRGDAGDPYPGSANNRTFNYSTIPNSRLYDGTNSLAAVANISAGCTTTMTADLTYNVVIGSKKTFLPFVMHKLAPAPTNPVRNGTFEAGTAYWTEYSSNGWDLIVTTFVGTVTAHGGTHAAWMGGDYNETSRLTQTSINMTGVRYLHFWYWIASDDICGYDFARVKVNNTQVKLFNLCGTNDTSGWVKQVVDLNSYTGTTISLQFEVTTDSSLNSNFFLDDISISASSTTAGEELFDASAYTKQTDTALCKMDVSWAPEP